MKRYLLVNMFILVFVNLLIKPIYIFGIDKNVQLALGEESYGVYVALFNLTVVFNMLLDMGITSYNTRSMAQELNASTRLRQLALIKLVLFFIFTIVVTITAFALRYTLLEFKLLLLLIGLQGANSFLQLVRSYYAGQQHFKWDAIISIADKLILIPIIGAYLVVPSWRNSFSIFHYAGWQFLSYLLVIAITIIIGLKKHLFNKSEIPFHLQTVIKNAIPIAVVIFFMAIYMRCDMFILERMHPKGRSETFTYAFCYRWLDALNMLGFLVAGMLLSLFAKYRNDKEMTNQIVKLTTQIILPAGLAISVWCYFFASDILGWLGKADLYTIEIFRIIMISFLGLCLIHIFSTLLTAHERYKSLIWICGIGALISVISNIFFVPNYGALASAWISLVVNIGLGIAYLIACVYFKNIPSFNKQWLQFIGLTILIIIINYLAHTYSNAFMALLLNGILVLGVLAGSKLKNVKQFLNS